MPMYNLVEYSDNYLKTSGSLWEYYRDDPNDNITQSESFKYKTEITGKTPANRNAKDVKIAVPLIKVLLINCEINLVLTWSEDCLISSETRATKFKITVTKLYVPVITLSIQDNAKLLQHLKPCFKRKINWNKYYTKVSTEGQNQYLDFLIDSGFQGVNRLFVLLFENEADRKYTQDIFIPNYK